MDSVHVLSSRFVDVPTPDPEWGAVSGLKRANPAPFPGRELRAPEAGVTAA
jgi:hypothetical protein